MNFYYTIFSRFFDNYRTPEYLDVTCRIASAVSSPKVAEDPPPDQNHNVNPHLCALPRISV
ncbi:MAG TPA: hypothetical protein VGN39_14215 [Terriglobales bacterium]|nr:hypothetical protein [Terriglobales bacterium]